MAFALGFPVWHWMEILSFWAEDLQPEARCIAVQPHPQEIRAEALGGLMSFVTTLLDYMINLPCIMEANTSETHELRVS